LPFAPISVELDVADKGLDVFRELLRDSEVSSDMNIRLTAMMPGVHIEPRNGTEEAKEAYRICKVICDSMSGALLTVLRDQMLKEALVTGMLIVEPTQKIISTQSFGDIVGVQTLAVRPSETFEGRIDSTPQGDIIGFTQVTSKGEIKVLLEDVIYYAYRSTPWNPYGESLLYSCYNAWKLKQTLFRLYAVLATVNASGIRVAHIPDTEFQRDKQATLQMLQNMSEYASVVLPESYKMDLQLPSSDAGGNFIKGINELCNKEIKKSILYDDTFNAEGMKTGSYASKKVSQSTVYEAMASEGKAYCDEIAKQLFSRFLEWNGLGQYPVPKLVPEPVSKDDTDPVPIVDAVVKTLSSSLFSITLPESVQYEMLSKVLAPIGINLEEQQVTAEPLKQITAKRLPSNRNESSLKRQKEEIIQKEEQAVSDFLKMWKKQLPLLVKSLTGELIDDTGAWKSTKFGEVRNSIQRAVTSGGANLRTLLKEKMVEQWDNGKKSAEEQRPIGASLLTTPVIVTEGMADDMMNQRTFLLLEKRYGELASTLYYQLENALKGNISPNIAISRITEELRINGMPTTKVKQMVNTSLMSAYNDGRMAIFSPLSDPLGESPGGIIGYHFSAIMDDVTTEICKLYNGHNFKVDDPNLPLPPMWYNCRSQLIPIFTGEEPLGNGEWTSFSKSKKMSADIAEGWGGT